MRAVLLVPAALLGTVFVACAELPGQGTDRLVMPAGSMPGVSGPVTEMLDSLGAAADRLQSLAPDAAGERGRLLLEMPCEAGDLTCQGLQTGTTKVPFLEGVPVPAAKEGRIDFGEETPCRFAGLRPLESVWGRQLCRREVDFAADPSLVSTSSDVYTRVSGGNGSFVLSAGTAGNDYWHNGVFRRRVTFAAGPPEAYDSFKIVHVAFDDWLEVRLNGAVVYTGPHGGNGLYLSGGGVCYAPGRCGSRELWTSWSFRPDVDVRAHLRAGQNTLDILVVVGGGGEFHMSLAAIVSRDYTEAALAAQVLRSCASLERASCEREGRGGCLYSRNGVCVIYEQVYLCPQQAASREKIACGMPDPCAGGGCTDRPPAADNAGDFADAVAWTETARQAALGAARAGPSMFAGELSSCRDKVGWGLADCCRAGGERGHANSAVLAALGAQLLVRGAPSAGSLYMHDTLFMADDLAASLGALGKVAGNALQSFAPSLSYYGVQVKVASGGLSFSFDPASFAVAVAVAVISDLLSCEPEEQLLSLKTGSGLCVKVREYCARRLFGCFEEVEEYCCYRSKLGRILAEQGKAQLGQPLHEQGRCRGFTQQEFAALDFAGLDFGEFLADIAPSAAATMRVTGYRRDAERAMRESVKRGQAAAPLP